MVCAMGEEVEEERLFQIVDPETRKLVASCDGPDSRGDCPYRLGSLIPCAGLRVIPLSGTIANGLPFSVQRREWDGCPLEWLTYP